MRAFDITEDQWSLYLAPQLTGRAQQAYAALDGDEAADYETVKTAILRRFAINSDTYRQRLRAAKLGKDETANELRTRLLHYTTKWLDKLLDALVLEQLYTSLPSEVARHVREQDPASASKAAVLADAYFAAHASSSYGQFDTGTRRPAQDRPRCMNCGRYGHFASNCWWTRRARSDDSSDKTRPVTSARSDLPAATQADTSSRSSGSSWTEQNEIVDARLVTTRLVSHVSVVVSRVTSSVPVRRQVPTFVEHLILTLPLARLFERPVFFRKDWWMANTWRIFASTQDAARRWFTAHSYRKMLCFPTKQWTFSVHTVTLPLTLRPVADVELVIDDVAQEIRVGVAQSLPHSVLLGTDVPHLIDLLATPTPDAPEDALVATRAQLRRQERDASLRYTRQLEDDARTHSLINHSDAETDVSSSLTAVSPPPATTPDDVDTPELMPLDQGHDDVDESDSLVFSFDDDIFAQPGSSRTRLSRSERRRHNRQVTSEQADLDLCPETLRTLQRADGTLHSLWRSAHPSPDALTGSGFFLSGNGLLYHRWHPGRDASSPVDQLVLPSHCRRHVLELAHSIPLAGHLGVAKTTHRLLHRFFWPSLHADVKRFCNECHECQKTSTRRPLRAPLVPLPIIDEPFHRIGMDLVGPLPRTAAGNKFILVICDYATRYPEAIALPDITAETVAEHLITLFTRVGIPAEILTDQGANFMSALLNPFACVNGKIDRIRSMGFEAP